MIELIVLTAILAILAGVGVTAYVGYTNAAKKAADKQTVEDILHAAQIGSHTHDLTAPVQVPGESSGLQLPGGFVLLTTDGATAYSSGATVTNEEEPCALSKVSSLGTGVKFVKGFASDYRSVTVRYSLYSGFLNGSAQEYYIPEENMVNYSETYYCRTHSLLNKGLVSAYYTADETQLDADEGSTKTTAFTPLVFLGEQETIHGPADGHTVGAGFSSDLPTIQSNGVVTDGGTYEVMIDAYGVGWADVKLQYGGWASYTLPSILSDGQFFLDELKDWADEGLCARDVSDFAARIAADGKETFLAAWVKADSSGERYTQKLNRDVCRLVYNLSFLTYLNQNYRSVDHTCTSVYSTADALVEALKNWGDGNGLVNDPNLICEAAWTSGTSTMLPAIRNCEGCHALYRQYVSSGASSENASVMYDTLQTVRNTWGTAVTCCGSADYADYYLAYMEEFARLYGTITSAGTEGTVLIMMYSNADGSMRFTVYPDEADPRND
ncbi:MAG: type II secretion system GspH family protein [Clostridiales bacterium]|nr:type II secretion system GspH family protein [Clostridiales bacterium]